MFRVVSRPANHIVSNELSQTSQDNDRTYSDYMISQITGSLTEFTWNFRVLNIANPQVNYAYYLRIADYIGIPKFRYVSAEYTVSFDLPN